MNDELGLEEDDLWGRVVDDVEMGGDEDEQAIAALAMEVAGVSGASARIRESNRQHFLEAARSLSVAARESQRPNAEELLRMATENAPQFQPKWADPSQIAARMRTGNGIEVGGSDHQNVAYLPLGAGEGRALRTVDPFPRSAPFASFNLSAQGNLSQDRRQRRAFGFRVAFEHPRRETGASMGGCYLVGVTTSAFTAFGERNGLQQSPYFWGIEDGGNRFEGSRYGHSARSSRRGSSSFSVEMGPGEAPRNADNVLFGSRDVVSVVVDFDSRSLTFWRNEQLLGTLVTNLPRSGNLYPVVVPFNAGVTVAICGMDNDPLPLLRTFASDWRQAQQEKDDQRRRMLEAQRAILIRHQRPTTELTIVLRKIFSLYANTTREDSSNIELRLDYTAAARLWYRCGLKLSSLDSLLQEKSAVSGNAVSPMACFEDFLNLIVRILQEDDSGSQRDIPVDRYSSSFCEVGDKVELVEGYERYGDASGGPLQPGDRGTVVEIQQGPNGERHSIRVLFNGRRWWYQPPALLPERSGLTETPGVWFLRTVLRAHGYDHTTLLPLVGTHVSNQSWMVGDVVAPRKTNDHSSMDPPLSPMDSCVGRVVAENSSSPATSLTGRGRDSGTVLIEFISRSFGEATGALTESSQPGDQVLETRRVRVSKLVHTSVFHGSVIQGASQQQGVVPKNKDRPHSHDGDTLMDMSDVAGDEDYVNFENPPVREKIISEMKAISELDVSTIEKVTKDCRKKPVGLATAFSAGLPSAVIAAVELAEERLSRSDAGRSLPHAIESIGGLAALIAEQLCSEKNADTSSDEDIHESDQTTLRSLPSSGTGPAHDTDPHPIARAALGSNLLDPATLNAFGMGDRSLIQDISQAGRLSSLQQRRNMLLALMSRARRPAGVPSELFLERDLSSRDFALAHMIPSLGHFRQGPPGPFFYNPQGELAVGASWDVRAGSGEDVNSNTAEAVGGALSNRDRPGVQTTSSPSRSGNETPLLESILRCRGEPSGSSSVPGNSSGSVQSANFRVLINNGLLCNSLAWVRAAVEAQRRRTLSKASRRSPQVLHAGVDDEGTPLLLLAVSLGCSEPILSYLVECGAPVGETELKKAALTDQPRALSTLLEHAVYKDGIIDLAVCSPGVACVLKKALARQQGREKEMREQAGVFMAVLLRKLFKLLLSSRRNKSTDLCNKSIAGVMVGSILLRALHMSQRTLESSSATGNADDETESGHFPVDGTGTPKGVPSQGLLRAVPRDVLRDCLLSDPSGFTIFLLVVEEYLCSKDVNDSAIGLTLLATVLREFPFLSVCPEIERYGMTELVMSHEVLAVHKLAEIMVGVSAVEKPPCADPAADQDTGVNTVPHIPRSTLQCPKRHTAVLHVTRHSSFRCDICGKGVERGRPMHGCRECDWDACEECTDQAEGGIVKWNHIKELSSECKQLLSTETYTADKDSEWNESILSPLACHDNSSHLNSLSDRLLHRDEDVIKDLASLLDSPGQVTAHQFLTILLPALHSSLIGKTSENVRLGGSHAGFGPRSKKAKVLGGSLPGSGEPSCVGEDSRMSFCLAAAKMLVKDAHQRSQPTADEDGKEGFEKPSSQRDGQDGNESDDGMVEQDAGVQVHESRGAPELLRRLHQILSLYETVALNKNTSTICPGGSSGPQSSSLQTLTQPIEITLAPSSLMHCSNSISSDGSTMCIRSEPLTSMNDLELHVLRSCRFTHPSYKSFCRRLAVDKAVIVERSLFTGTGDIRRTWRLARIVDYDEESCSHKIQYASALKSSGNNHKGFLELRTKNCLKLVERIQFDGEEKYLRLSAREYFILYRCPRGFDEELSKSPFNMERLLSDDFVSSPGGGSHSPKHSVGSRIESDCGSPDGSWEPFTILSIRSEMAGDLHFAIVSDSGEVHLDVRPNRIRGLGGSTDHSSESASPERFSGRGRDNRGHASRAFPFFAGRRHQLARNESRDSSNEKTHVGILRRSWSALSLVEKMQPIEINITEESKASYKKTFSNGALLWECRIGGEEMDVFAERGAVEMPPDLRVKFSGSGAVPVVDVSGTTVIGALMRLQHKEEVGRGDQVRGGQPFTLFYSVSTDMRRLKEKDEHFTKSVASVGYGASWAQVRRESEALQCSMDNVDDVCIQAAAARLFASPLELDSNTRLAHAENRSRKLSLTSYLNDDDACYSGICDGLDEICVQCIEVIELLAEFSIGTELPGDQVEVPPSLFENAELSCKLQKQLDDPLMVAGGALPEWCTVAPAFAPRLFSYESRRLLLERTGFGASRSALRLQEAKVNVGRLRQRMASLRGRAVELVGEAFSGGAEDPTALQLQADELYGMEEALAARVKAAFRQAKWDERALQVAKAAVRRDKLLSDAAAVMYRYVNDERVCRRRLEVRFEGESGFDAASGNEAGVTRGFYADVAEALLSCEHVAGVHCRSACSPDSIVSSRGKMMTSSAHREALQDSRIPLWIPDMDSSNQVVIPTPRADPRSGLGVFPRPLPTYHPQRDDVLVRFRLIGRLFAAAMRDGFMFPLPLSASFLKLVQHGSDSLPGSGSKTWVAADNQQGVSVSLGQARCGQSEDATRHRSPAAHNVVLTSSDLPRPGFLGGDVCAVEIHICRSLDRLDEADPPLSKAELELCYQKIARDKNFARVALGKTYDCSFNDYFQDRTFVDPLDPTQGEDAVPLCPNGHQRPVTIHNVREWVALSKIFILHTGVIAQALAFRRGVEDFFPPAFLRLFTPGELQRDVCGVGDNVDTWDDSAIRNLFKLDGGKGAAEALVAVAAIGGEGGAALSRRFSPSSATITFLVKALLEAKPQQRRQFLSFVTSVPIVTPGRIEVVPIVSPSGEFLPMQDPGCLPRANTCARRLYLPRFDTYELFSQVLWAVVREECKFKGFYEWRG